MCLQYLLQSLQQSDISAVGTEHAPPAHQYRNVSLSDAPAGDMLGWLANFSDHAHVRLGCTLLQMPSAEVVAHASYFWAVLESLRPNEVLRGLVQRAVTQLHSLGNRESFTFLHLRVENDWLAHCFRWSHWPVGPASKSLAMPICMMSQ